MAKTTLNNGDTGGTIRAAINAMFSELYAKFVAAAADADGYLAKEDWATFNGKQDTLSAATAAADGYLKKEDWSTFNDKQSALTDPVTLVAAPATAAAAGTKGQVAIDTEYIYLCTATDTWKRAALAFDTWGA